VRELRDTDAVTSDQTHEGARENLARALVLLQRYSTDITVIARRTLGDGDRIGNNEIAIILALHGSPGPLPSGAIADALGLDRSQVSRYLGRLEEQGAVIRRGSLADGRRRDVALTALGRRRIVRFSRELGDYFAEGAPLMKEALPLLGRTTGAPKADDPLAAAMAMSAAGAAFVADAVDALRRFGIRADTRERFTLGLLLAFGQQRPSQLAAELGCDPAGVTVCLDRLEAAGLVVRAHGTAPGERRSVIVTLTADGQAAGARLLDAVERHRHALGDALAGTLRELDGKDRR